MIYYKALWGVSMDKLDIFKKYCKEIFLVDSPSGYVELINEKVISLLNKLNIKANITNKGTIEIFVKGKDSSKKIGVCAHIDTLGLMVRSINSDGTLNVTNIGGPLIPTLDGEYCRVRTRDNKVYTGTILSTSPSIHVFPDSKSKPRDIDNIVVRLDEVVKSKDDVLKLGINNGDYVCYDTKLEFTESGFMKSRFIDDKGSVCSLLSVLELMVNNKVCPKYDTYIYFTNYEEVGTGASSINSLDELLAVDMGCVGMDLSGNEMALSICAKDSGGPYNYEFTTRLINLAKDNNIDYVVDIFPFYGSDAGAALRSGLDAKAGLIGPGVASSHGMERTHLKAIEATIDLVSLYLFGTKLN